MASPVPGEAPYINQRGEPFYQLFQHYPSLEIFYTNFEKNFNPKPVYDFAYNHPEIPIISGIIYLLFCYFGQTMMVKRDRFDLRYPLAYWNLFLSVFSFCGMIRTVPHLLHNLMSYEFSDTICVVPSITYGCGAAGFWSMLFIFSKVPELFDSIFIVLRKRPLIFLHWYHHITVMLFCWHSYVFESTTGLYFIAMNYTVHAIMYGYYFLMALRIKPPIPAWTITIAQISQMFVGTFICTMSWYYKKTIPGCNVSTDNVIAGAVMYASYLILFVHFALQRFVFKSKGAKDV
jgi:elongation of very long chain fatty acids protein 6